MARSAFTEIKVILAARSLRLNGYDIQPGAPEDLPDDDLQAIFDEVVGRFRTLPPPLVAPMVRRVFDRASVPRMPLLPAAGMFAATGLTVLAGIVGFGITIVWRSSAEPVVQGRPVSEWVRQLEHAHPGKRKQAHGVLEAAINGEDSYTSSGTLRTLRELGPEAGAAVPLLVRALRHADARTRSGAARALGSIGPQARDALPALQTALEKEADEGVKQWLAWSIETIEAEAEGGDEEPKGAGDDDGR